MKQPELIKKGLEWSATTDVIKKVEMAKKGLPYAYSEELASDALAYIALLEAGNAGKLKRIAQLESSLAQVERERDALICNHIPQTCDTCKYSLCFSFDNPCNTCNHLYRFNAVERGDTDRWEFVGVCAENTKEASP